MASRLEDIVIRLQAENADLSRKLTSSERQIARFGQRGAQSTRRLDTAVSRLNRSFVRLGGVIATAFSVRAFTQAARATLGFANQLQRTRDLLDIGAETLQLFRVEAEKLGFATTAVDTGLQRFRRRFEEAAAGGGEAKKTFRELGIELRNGDDTLRSTEAVLFDVADALKEGRISGENLRRSFKLFDSEFAGFELVLRQGADALRELQREYRSLGIIISEEAIAKGAEVDRQFRLITRQVAGPFKEAIIALSPVLLDVGRAFASLSRKIADVFEQARGESIRGLRLRLNDLQQALRQNADELERLQTKPSIAERLFGTETQLRGAIQARQTISENIRKVREDIAALKADLGDGGGGGGGGLDGGGAGGGRTIDEQLKEVLDRNARAVRAANRTAERSIDEQLKDVLDRNARAVERANGRIKKDTTETAEIASTAFERFGDRVASVFAGMVANSEVTAQGILRAFAAIGLETLIRAAGQAATGALTGFFQPSSPTPAAAGVGSDPGGLSLFGGGGGASAGASGMVVNVFNSSGAAVEARPSLTREGIDVFVRDELQSLAARDQIAPVARRLHQVGVR